MHLRDELFLEPSSFSKSEGEPYTNVFLWAPAFLALVGPQPPIWLVALPGPQPPRWLAIASFPDGPANLALDGGGLPARRKDRERPEPQNR